MILSKQVFLHPYEKICQQGCWNALLKIKIKSMELKDEDLMHS